MQEPLRILATITSNPLRVEELQAGISEVASRGNRPVQLQIAGDRSDQLARIVDARILLTYRVDPELFGRAAALEWIHFGAAGIDRSLFPALTESDVTITTARGIHGDVMGEYAAMALIALAKGLPLLMDAQRRRVWAGREVRPLHRSVQGSRLLVLGLGSIGREAARRAADLGMRVIGVKRTPWEGPVPDWLAAVHTAEELEGLLPEADFLLLTLPLTDRTRGIMDARRLGLLPQGAGVVNMARGALLDEGALVAALDSGRLGGAFLDCFETEPLPEDSPLWHHPGVIVTPHMSGNFESYTHRVIRDFLENLDRYLAGSDLKNPFDRTAGY